MMWGRGMGMGKFRAVKGSSGEEYDFDVLDEKDGEGEGEETVDEESDGQQGGAGMEIDMEL